MFKESGNKKLVATKPIYVDSRTGEVRDSNAAGPCSKIAAPGQEVPERFVDAVLKFSGGRKSEPKPTESPPLDTSDPAQGLENRVPDDLVKREKRGRKQKST